MPRARDSDSPTSANRTGLPNLTAGQSFSAINEHGSVRNLSNSNAAPLSSADIGTGSDHLVRQDHIPKPRQFLTIYVNTGQYIIKLGEIKLSTICNDGELFANIADRYRQVRGSRINQIFMRPVNAHDILVCLKISSLTPEVPANRIFREKVQSTAYL